MVLRSVLTIALLFCVAEASNAGVVHFNAPGTYASYSEAGLTFTPLAPSTSFGIDAGGSGVGGSGKWNSIISNSTDNNAEITVSGGPISLNSIYIDHMDTGDPLEWKAFLGATLVGTEVIPGNVVEDATYLFTTLNSLLFDRVEVRSLGNDFNDWELDDLAFTQQDVQIPEPASLTLFGLGGLGLIAARRRRQAA